MISCLLKEDESLNSVFLILFWAPIRCMRKSPAKATLASSQSSSLVSVIWHNTSFTFWYPFLSWPVLPPTITIKRDELSNLNNEKLFSHSLDAGSLKIKGPISSDPREVGLCPCVSDDHLLCHIWPFLGLHEYDEREEFSLWVSEERQWPHDKSFSLMSQLVTKVDLSTNIYMYCESWL